MYNPGCCGKTFYASVCSGFVMPEAPQPIGTNSARVMSFALIRQSVLPEISFSDAVRFAEDEARFHLF